jgi:hypothetical protein
MKRLFVLSIFICLIANFSFAQWKYNNSEDTIKLSDKRKDKINIWVLDVVGKNILEKPDILKIITIINSNQIDTGLFAIKILIRTGIEGPVCLENRDKFSGKKKIESFVNDYPIILIDTSLYTQSIINFLNNAITNNERRHFKPLQNTSALNIVNDDNSETYNLLLKFVTGFSSYIRNISEYKFSNISVYASPQVYNGYTSNVGGHQISSIKTKTTVALGLEYNTQLLQKKRLNSKGKFPWMSLGFGIRYSSATCNNELRFDSVSFKTTDYYKQQYTRIVSGKDINEEINLTLISFQIPLTFTVAATRKRDLFFDVKIIPDLTYLWGSAKAKGYFTYTGKYYEGTEFETTLSNLPEYGFYSNYPIDTVFNKSDLPFKPWNFSLHLCPAMKVKITANAYFILGIDFRFGLTDLLKDHNAQSYLVSSAINDYNSLFFRNSHLFANQISLNAGINISF